MSTEKSFKHLKSKDKFLVANVSNYTMHTKFSNCFVCMSPSTSDIKFHLLSCRYKRRTSDKNFH